MIIGSHNTMTYAKPRKWWMHVIVPFAVCQTKDVDEQILEGVRCFDLRIRLKKDKWVFAHGLYEVDGDVYATIDKIRNYADYLRKKVYIRIVLERNKTSRKETERFVKFCEMCENQLGKYIVPFEGRLKSGWKELYSFKYRPKSIIQNVSSMATDARWYEKAIPFLYAFRKNEENKCRVYNNKIVLYDFI